MMTPEQQPRFVVKHGDRWPLLQFAQDGVPMELPDGTRATYHADTGETGDLRVTGNSVEAPGAAPAGSVVDVELHYPSGIIETVERVLVVD